MKDLSFEFNSSSWVGNHCNESLKMMPTFVETAAPIFLVKLDRKKWLLGEESANRTPSSFIPVVPVEFPASICSVGCFAPSFLRQSRLPNPPQVVRRPTLSGLGKNMNGATPEPLTKSSWLLTVDL